MFSVTISEKGGQQSKLNFDKPEITIGRIKGNDIVLPKNNVSKQHTRIYLRDAGFFIADLKSTNGTYVNGRKVVEEQAISESDKIYIGDFILQVDRAQSGFSPSPPQPPQAPAFGGQSPGRHFPTIMDGQAGGLSAALLAQNTPPPVASHRRTSNADMAQNPPTPPPQQPQLSQPDLSLPKQGRMPLNDLRKTIGDAGPFDFAGPIQQKNDSQPLTSLAEATPTPVPVTAGSPPTPPPVTGKSTPEAEVAPQIKPIPSEKIGADAAGISVIPAPADLEDEFDLDFHRAQQDVARVFFDSIALHEIPLDYPLPSGPERARIEEAVTNAINVVAPSLDRQTLTEAVIKEATGLGALEDYLDDPTVQAIYVNAHDRVLLRSEGTVVIAPRAYGHPDFLDLAARRLLGPQDVPPISDEVRFSDGTRVHILMPPLSVDGPTLTIRKPKTYFPNLPQLVEDDALSVGMAEFLDTAVSAGRSILIAGPTNAGKTTLLSALSELVSPSSRVIAIEQHSNLPARGPNYIRLEASPSTDFDMRFLLRNAVAMHPERILVDECRGAEAYDWVTATASGTDGSMITLHGSSAADALERLESMCLLGASEISPRGLREQIARAVDLVVVLHATPNGGIRIHQIAEVQGVDLDAFRLNEIFYFRVDGTSGAFHPTGYIPLFYEDLRHAGLDADLDIFRD